MINFKVGTYSGHSVRVEIYPTRKEFLEQYKKRFGLKGHGRACCFHYIDAAKRKKIGIIAFCAKDLNVGTISHEFIHVFTSIYAQSGWDYLNLEDNEKLAWNLGYAVGDCCVKIKQLGFEVKLTPD